MTQGSADEGRSGAGATITPLDIQQKEFRVSRFGGYRMRDVDEFLDRLTEVVTGLTEENARLRRQAAAGPVVGSPDLEDVARQADEIIQRARDEAARIDTEARARASTPSSAAPAMPDTEAVSTEPAVDEPPPPPAAVRPSEPDGGVVEVGEAEATQSLPATEERGKLAQTRPASGSGGERGGEGDPSLRELFWGEED